MRLSVDGPALLRGIERWLLPGECVLCLRPLAERDEDAAVCGLCRSRWRPLPEPQCGRCGHPMDAEGCLLCTDWPPVLARARSAVLLDGGARRAVHQLKYDGWPRLAVPMAEAMRALEPLTGRICLIPVPLARRRERDRGYNQSERLAAALALRLGVPVCGDLLRRTRETDTQTALTPDERRANVAGAFAASPASGLDLVLVDDVFTTGATLLAAAAALRAAGARRVEAVTFGRAIG
jgi:ComF family protein